ncbi:hypothetical protein Bca101_023607 [Brassica carinata]
MRVLGYERRWGSTIKEWPSLSTVEVRLLRFWEARNVRRDGELMGVDMCLVLRLVAQDTKLTPVAPLLKSYAKVEKLSSMILLSPLRLSNWYQDGEGMVLCFVLELFQETSTVFLLFHVCVDTSAVGVLRYRVEMAIADETGEGLFAGDSVNPEETDSAPFVKDMEGGTYTFQVRVGSYNFTANHQTFTISRINSVDDRVPHPEFVDNV